MAGRKVLLEVEDGRALRRVEGRGVVDPPERVNKWRLVAKRAIDASLELADELEAA